MKKDATKGDATSPVDDASTLVPTARSVIVTAPFDVDNWDEERKPARVRVRPMSAEQIVQSIGGLQTLVEKMEAGLTIAEIAAEAFDEALTILEVATDQTAAFMRGLDGADFLTVFEKVYTENERFFARARALLTGDMGQKVRALFRGGGPTSSSTLPNTDSPTQ